MIRKILISMAVLSASFMMNAYGSDRDNRASDKMRVGIDLVGAKHNHSHRFYSVEDDNDTTAHGIEYTIDAVRLENIETVTLSIRNTRHTPFQPLKAGLKLGVDTYMDTYPEWYDKFFRLLPYASPTYAYLLTGEERWLRETFDAASAFAALIDHKSGDLNWAFVVDPCVRALQVCEPDPNFTADDDTYGNPHPELYPNREIVVGEQYVPMIADWQTIVSSDNDVHECFKFIAEAVLCNAFLVERPDGSFGAYNCSFVKEGKNLLVTADEPQIKNLHVNLLRPQNVVFDGNITYFNVSSTKIK